MYACFIFFLCFFNEQFSLLSERHFTLYWEVVLQSFSHNIKASSFWVMITEDKSVSLFANSDNRKQVTIFFGVI